MGATGIVNELVANEPGRRIYNGIVNVLGHNDAPVPSRIGRRISY